MVSNTTDKKVKKLIVDACDHLDKVDDIIEEIGSLYATEPRHKEWLFIVEKFAENKKLCSELNNKMRWMH